MTLSKGHEYVARQVREAGVRLISLWFADVAGRLKSVAIPDEQLESALTDGIVFDGSTIAGRARREETDVLLIPDPDTFAILPWRANDESRVGRMFCDLVRGDGSPFDHDSRGVLKRALERARAAGYTVYIGAELEYYYFAVNTLPLEPIDSASYFDATPAHRAMQLRRDTVFGLEQIGVAVESTHHEVGPGQYELKLQYTDALAMADAVVTSRLCARRIAELHGMIASFMPKPLGQSEGSGLHLTLSLVHNDQDAFFNPADPLHLSDVAKSFIAGLLAQARPNCVVTNQWVNSYKRLISGSEAPSMCSWACTNWSDLIRVPSLPTREGGLLGIEYRAPDPACNPYLAFAALLEAGLDGVTQQRVPPPMREGVDRSGFNAPPLPQSLWEAATAAAESSLLRKTMGERLVETLVENAHKEWAAYHGHVSQWELERYFPTL